MRPRWSHARRSAKALELLRDPALDGLITGECAVRCVAGEMRRLAREPADALCLRIVYPNAQP